MQEVPHLRNLVALTDREILKEFSNARKGSIVSKVLATHGLKSHPIGFSREFGACFVLVGIFSGLLVLMGLRLIILFAQLSTDISDHLILFAVPIVLVGVGLVILFADIGIRRPTHPIVLESALQSLLARTRDAISNHELDAEERVKWISRIHRQDTLIRRRRQSQMNMTSKSEQNSLTSELLQLETDRAQWVQFVADFDREQSELFAIKRQIEEMAEPVLLALATRDASEVMAKAEAVNEEVLTSTSEREQANQDLVESALSIREQLLQLRTRAKERHKAELRLRE